MATTSVALPAATSTAAALPDRYFANFKGTVAAKKEPFEALFIAGPGVRPLDREVARTIMVAVEQPPPQEAGV